MSIHRCLLVGLSVVLVTLGCGEQPSPPASVEAPSQSVEAEVTQAAFNVDGSPTVELHVPGMMCPHGCAPKVREVLASQSGAKGVKVDFSTKTAVVAVDDAEFDPEQALAALADYGFEDSAVVEQ